VILKTQRVTACIQLKNDHGLKPFYDAFILALRSSRMNHLEYELGPTMFFWLRELAGWGLILVSLYLIRVGLVFISDLENPGIVQAAIVLIAAVGVMRCGVFLIRISAATRAAMTLESSKVTKETTLELGRKIK